MKRSKLTKNSLGRKFIHLMVFFISAFILSAVVLLYSFSTLNQNYTAKTKELEKKQKIAAEIGLIYNETVSNIRGYIAYGNKDLKAAALDSEPEIRRLTSDFRKIVTDRHDQEFITHVDIFTEYYFGSTMPDALENYENGNLESVVRTANTGATEKISAFKRDSRNYLDNIDSQIAANFQELTKIQVYVQIGFVAFILLFMIVLLRLTRLMFSEIAKPLASFAQAANEMANGGEAVLDVHSKRNDELGILSEAFHSMVTSIQENEQNLLAQNEELMAQQDELHAQQLELQDALEVVKTNEQKLNDRNELINKIANSLDKQEVLESVVMNMCPIIGAEQGIIAFINEDSYASYGISPEGVKQFRSNLRLSGMVERIETERKPFTVKRESDEKDKGFHLGKLYLHDLYLPIFLSGEKVVAIMAFSRSSAPFESKRFEEYEALAKNIGIALDKISIYQKSEEARVLNQDILDTIQEGVQLVDSYGAIIQVNKQFCEMFGCPGWLKALNGCSWDEWTALLEQYIAEPEKFVAFLRKEVASKVRDSLNERQFIYKTRTGQVYKVYCEGLFEGKSKLGTIFVHRNITKEFEVDRIKSEFVSTVSHELRTPLASILGFTELIMTRELKPERQKKYLTTIYSEAGRLTALINDFLDIQRMEAGKQCYENEELELLPIIQKVIDFQKINGKKHELILEHIGGSDIVIGDREKLEQVFINLIHNAIKYSPEGGEIRVAVFEKAGNVYVEIKDEGLGIPAESIGKVFEKFYRVDNSDHRSIGGTGLGLALVKEILGFHGGDVSVESQYGMGSTFTVTLPVKSLTGSPAFAKN